ncbi:hypothetical protein ACLQ2P_11660, partial [Actinomadura citrea]
AIARSITNPSQQARAWTSLAEAVAATGDLDRSRQLTDQAETIARSITDPSQQAEALASLAKTVTKVGDLDAAKRLLATALITIEPGPTLQALAAVAPQAVVAVAPNWLGVEVAS